ncbi:DUF5906 domain-containing protein [Pseudomonas kielensis]|uniref:primase-helicase family protein n=1 Tax=Pseudomonas kielensis TaxID=2762577 RepID=UPI00223F676D|nr:primase-helicase family protein [Pseudomonas kielensis]UZM14599.1 DUF5906 domain-containing protein [Pseudomonas kielensis]
MTTKPPKPALQTVQTIGSQTATVTLSTPANDPALPKMSDADAERLATVRQVVPLKVIHFGTSDYSTQQASQTRTDDVVTATGTQRRGPDIDMKKVQAETDRKVRENSAKRAERTGSGMKIDNESKEILRYISEDFVMLTRASSVVAYHVESGDELGKEGLKQFCSKHYGDIVLIDTDKDGNQTTTRAAAGDIWWAWNDPARRVVRRIVMEPTSKPENDDNPEVFNRWHVLKLTMAEPNLAATTDDIGILLRHLLYLSGDDAVGVAFFLNWLAQLYQTPEIKMPTAVLLYSKAGRVGKNLMQRLLTKVFGEPLVGGCTGKQLQKNFDDAIEHKRLVFINEVVRSDKVDGYEHFKSQVSEQSTQFEGKGRASKEIRNITHYIVTTNHEDALPLMERDGRVAVLRCLEPRKEDAYYKALVQWIDGPGAAALAGVLTKWQFPKGWDAYAPVPQTAAARAMQAAARGELEALLGELIEAGKEPCDRDIVIVDELCAKLNTLYSSSLGKPASRTSAGRALKAIGAEYCEKRIEGADGETRNVKFYVLRNKEQWANATPKQRGDHHRGGMRLFAVQPQKAEVSDGEN